MKRLTPLLPLVLLIGILVSGLCGGVAGWALVNAGGLQMTEQFTVEIEGEAKPACVAEVIMRLYF